MSVPQSVPVWEVEPVELVRRAVRDDYRTNTGGWTGINHYGLSELTYYSGGERTFPLLDLALTRSDCERLIADAGLPVPPKSRCWMCPHQSNAEWRSLTADERARAVALDDEVRDADERGGVYLHQSRTRLADVDLDESDRKVPEGAQCGFGGCWL